MYHLGVIRCDLWAFVPKGTAPVTALYLSSESITIFSRQVCDAYSVLKCVQILKVV